jgi:hypothetical protein
MADFTNLPQEEQSKLRYDLYKLRVDEFRGRYESMRELESGKSYSKCTAVMRQSR